MMRREFIEMSALTGSALKLKGSALNTFPSDNLSGDITWNTLPVWRGFNLLEKFTDKPDEWMTVAPEWGYKNEPFREV